MAKGVVNPDGGSQCTGKKRAVCVWGRNTRISTDGKGGSQTGAGTGIRAIGNLYIEKLWRTVKYDYVYLSPPENGREFF